MRRLKRSGQASVHIFVCVACKYNRVDLLEQVNRDVHHIHKPEQLGVSAVLCDLQCQ
jgi:hypothetical protein